MRPLPLAAAFLVFSASVGMAAPPGFNIAWTPGPNAVDNCPSQLVNNTNEEDACSSSVTTHWLICSLVAPPGLTEVAGEDIYIDIQTATSPLDPYWHLEQGGCRFGDIVADADCFPFSQATCAEYWGNSGYSGGIAWTPFISGPNHAQFEASFAMSPGNAGPWTPGAEYYLLWVRIKGGAVPANCGGCQDGASFTLQEVDISGGPTNAKITNASTRPFATWQEGAVSAHRATWGEVKSLYRN